MPPDDKGQVSRRTYDGFGSLIDMGDPWTRPELGDFAFFALFGVLGEVNGVLLAARGCRMIRVVAFCDNRGDSPPKAGLGGKGCQVIRRGCLVMIGEFCGRFFHFWVCI